MMLKSHLSSFVFCALFLIGCGGTNSDKSESKESAAAGAATPTACNEPSDLITQEKAQKLVTRYNNELNTSGEMTRYVSKDIASLREMLDYFECHGKTHVKFYFGMDVYAPSGEERRDRLTIFMEGARTCGEGPGADPSNPCLDDGEPTEEIKPFDLNHPCPPPACWGRSRYIN